MLEDWLDGGGVCSENLSQLLELGSSQKRTHPAARGTLALALGTGQSCWDAVQNVFYGSLGVSEGSSQGLDAFFSWETHAHKFVDFVLESWVFLLLFCCFGWFSLCFLFVFHLLVLLWLLLFFLFYFWCLLFLGLGFLKVNI